MNKEKLIEQIRSKKTFLCVGLDPDVEKMPKHILDEEDPIFEFNKEIIDATAELARAFIVHRAEAGLKASSLARQLSAVRQFHKHLYLEGRRSDDPTSSIEGPRRNRPVPKVLSVADIDRLLRVAQEGLDDPARPTADRLRALRQAGRRVLRQDGTPLALCRSA